MSERFGWTWFDRFWQTASLIVVCIALALELRACLAGP
jgi:hypothetical protein